MKSIKQIEIVKSKKQKYDAIKITWMSEADGYDERFLKEDEAEFIFNNFEPSISEIFILDEKAPLHIIQKSLHIISIIYYAYTQEKIDEEFENIKDFIKYLRKKLLIRS